MTDLTGTRVLHIVEPWAGPRRSWLSGGVGCDTLAAACGLFAAGGAGRFLVLGPARGERRAGDLGILTTDTICPPAGLPALAWTAVQRFIRASGPYDAVVCWGARARALARHLHRVAPAVYRALLRVGEGSTPRARFDGAGPALERGAWRDEHGVPEHEPVVALLDDAAYGADARRFLFTLGSLEVAGRRVTGLMPSGAGDLTRARRFRRGVGLGTRVIVADRPMQCLMGVCDAGVLLGPFDDAPRPEGSSAGLARFNLMLAMAAGIPVVTAERPGVTDGLPGPARALLARSDHSNDIGRELFDLVHDAGLRASVRAALLHAARADGPRWSDGLRIEPVLSGHQGGGA